jgi:hypothetical protein
MEASRLPIIWEEFSNYRKHCSTFLMQMTNRSVNS